MNILVYAHIMDTRFQDTLMPTGQNKMDANDFCENISFPFIWSPIRSFSIIKITNNCRTNDLLCHLWLPHTHSFVGVSPKHKLVISSSILTHINSSKWRICFCMPFSIFISHQNHFGAVNSQAIFPYSWHDWFISFQQIKSTAFLSHFIGPRYHCQAKCSLWRK